ncbi:MAG: hypothetical protein EBY32_07090 [Proteobacteria bacterium]|nr:hypothetical protein [Pseudomonadota bacterium]
MTTVFLKDIYDRIDQSTESRAFGTTRKTHRKKGDKSMMLQNKVIVAFAILASANLACVASEEVQLTSDNFACNKETKAMTFSGNILITLNGATLKAEKATVTPASK